MSDPFLKINSLSVLRLSIFHDKDILDAETKEKLKILSSSIQQLCKEKQSKNFKFDLSVDESNGIKFFNSLNTKNNTRLDVANKQNYSYPESDNSSITFKGTETDGATASSNALSPTVKISWRPLPTVQASSWDSIAKEYVAIFGNAADARQILQNVNAEVFNKYPAGLPAGTVIELPITKQWDQPINIVGAVGYGAPEVHPAPLTDKNSMKLVTTSYDKHKNKLSTGTLKSHSEFSSSYALNKLSKAEWVNNSEARTQSDYTKNVFKIVVPEAKMTSGVEPRTDNTETWVATMQIPNIITKQTLTAGELFGTLSALQASPDAQVEIWNTLTKLNPDIDLAQPVAGKTLNIYRQSVQTRGVNNALSAAQIEADVANVHHQMTKGEQQGMVFFESEPYANLSGQALFSRSSSEGRDLVTYDATPHLLQRYGSQPTYRLGDNTYTKQVVTAFSYASLLTYGEVSKRLGINLETLAQINGTYPNDGRNQKFNHNDLVAGKTLVVYRNTGSVDDQQAKDSYVNVADDSSVSKKLRTQLFELNRATFQSAFNLLPLKDPTAIGFLTNLKKVQPSCGGYIYAANQAVIALCDQDPAFSAGKGAEVATASALAWNGMLSSIGSANPTLARQLIDLATKASRNPQAMEKFVATINSYTESCRVNDPTTFQKIGKWATTAVGASNSELVHANTSILQTGFIAATVVHGAGLMVKAIDYASAPSESALEQADKAQKLADLQSYAYRSLPKDIAFAVAATKAKGVLTRASQESKHLLTEANAIRQSSLGAADEVAQLAKVKALEENSAAILGKASAGAGKIWGAGFAALDVGTAGYYLNLAMQAQNRMNVHNQVHVAERDESWYIEYKKFAAEYTENNNLALANGVNAVINFCPQAVLPALAINAITALACPSREELIITFKEHGLVYESSDNPWLGIDKSFVPVNFAANVLFKFDSELISDVVNSANVSDNHALRCTEALISAYSKKISNIAHESVSVLYKAANNYSKLIQAERAAGRTARFEQ